MIHNSPRQARSAALDDRDRRSPNVTGRRLPKVWRPTPTGSDVLDRQTSSRRVVVRMAGLPPGRSPRWWDACEWLREVCGTGSRPEPGRGGGEWLVARKHFRAVVEELACLYGEVEVFADQTATRGCGRWCWEAVREECECSCFGEHHGGQGWRKEWIKVSDDWLVTNVKRRSRYRVDRASVRRGRAAS